MAGTVSYELLASKLGTDIGFTSEGGIYQSYINDTGATSVKGTVVQTSSSVDDAVSITTDDSFFPIGVIYESGVANGDPVKVVTYGKAYVLLKDETPAIRGYWCGQSDVAGRMYEAATVPATGDHFREIGHALESKNAGTDVLALIQLHFN